MLVGSKSNIIAYIKFFSQLLIQVIILEYIHKLMKNYLHFLSLT